MRSAVERLAAKGPGSRQGTGKSQGGQDARLHQIFAAIGVLNRSYVEFGYQGRSTSNTFALWKDGWNGLLLDGNPRWVSKTDASESNLHRANCRGLVLSWAVLNQMGHGHVNCHSNEYVTRQLEGLGYTLNHALTERCVGQT